MEKEASDETKYELEEALKEVDKTQLRDNQAALI